jgi:hypothetical protein
VTTKEDVLQATETVNGIILPEHDGLWEEVPLYAEAHKQVIEFARSSFVLVYRKIPFGSVPRLKKGDRVEFDYKPGSEQSVFTDAERGFVIDEQSDLTVLVAHSRGFTKAVPTSSIRTVDRRGKEIWRRAKEVKA